MSTSFFDMIVISSWAEPIYVCTLHLGLVYPIISKLSFSITFNLPARRHAWLSPRIIIVCSLFCSLNYDFFFIFLFSNLILALSPNLNSPILDKIFWDLWLCLYNHWNFIQYFIWLRMYFWKHIISVDSSNVVITWIWEHLLALLECLSFPFLKFWNILSYHFQWGHVYHLIYSISPGVSWW